jgi:hypothetical protein
MWQADAWVGSWCPMNCGPGSSRCCPFRWSRPSSVARGARTAPACAASSLYSGPASPGGICPPRCSAAVASPAGDVCRSGPRSASFAACSVTCWMSLGSRARSTGPERRSIPAACELSEGDQDGPEPDGPRQTGLEAPSCRGPEGPTFDRAPHCGEPARQDRVAAVARGHTADSRAAGSTATAPAQGPRRQGLRLRRHPSRNAVSAHHPENRSQGYRVERKTRTPSLGRRADPRLVAPVQAAASSGRTTRGDAPHADGAMELGCCLILYREVEKDF